MKSLVLLVTLLTVAPLCSHAQNSSIHGSIADAAGKPAKGIAVSLLYPADSTLASFAITDAQGNYVIRNVGSGSYLLQAAGIDVLTYYQAVTLPMANNGAVPSIMLQPSSTTMLDGVQVVAEKIPILFKKDTIEYNAGSFKTRPDAPVEDLLKKLPGVEVDKAGNVKAQGKDVQHVLVDGKEFFSDDPKVATKNLPADAIDKVQVFDGLSQMAQYTGIDDGERDKTINLVLKDSKRRGYFGDVEAGGGTDERFKLNGHLYRFQKKSQLAVLGMLNNINQFGFSLQDYLSFSGGMRGLVEGGGGLQLNDRSPVNFGQQVKGLVTSGALGVNYTYEPKTGRRYNVSYMGTGADKKQDEQTLTQNFTDSATFIRNDDADERARDFGHYVNYMLRHDLDSTQQLRLSGNAGYNISSTRRNLLSSSTIRDALLNRLDSRIQDDADGINGSTNLAYIKRRKGPWPVVRLSAGGRMENTFSGTDWSNTTYFPAAGNVITSNQFQQNDNRQYQYNAAAAATRRLSNRTFLEPELRGAIGSDALQRRQGLTQDADQRIDSLSPSYARRYDWIRPGLTYRYSTEKLQYSIALREESGWLHSTPNNATETTRLRHYFLPSLFWQYNFKSTTTANASYNSSVLAPSALQMLPATDYTNPLQRMRGNPNLLPEQQHSLYASWRRFDAFSFTSMMTSLNGRYVHNKINWNRRINSDLSQDITYANMPDDYNLNGRAEYATPIRRLGINVTLGLSEQYNKGMNVVNDIMNINNTFTHGGKLKIDNRKKEKWDAELALSANYTESKYSLQSSLNSSFVQYNAYGQVSYRPKDYLYFSLTADIDRYQSKSFPDPVTVPLLQASASYYFLKARRGVLTIEAFDLLDRNRSIQRISQLNYLTEQRSNIIGRYVMLSFKYRLTATGSSGGNSAIRVQAR